MPEAGEGGESGAEPIETPVIEIDGETFDPERALKTIKAQRDKERELEKELAEFRKAKTEQEEKDKSLEQRLLEREGRIAELETTIAQGAIRSDFISKASGKFVDIELAYLAAEREGLLGKVDASGVVGEHDLDKLAEKYPALVGKAGGVDGTGDAGNRGRGKGSTPAELFNSIARGGSR